MLSYTLAKVAEQFEQAIGRHWCVLVRCSFKSSFVCHRWLQPTKEQMRLIVWKGDVSVCGDRLGWVVGLAECAWGMANFGFEPELDESTVTGIVCFVFAKSIGLGIGTVEVPSGALSASPETSSITEKSEDSEQLLAASSFARQIASTTSGSSSSSSSSCIVSSTIGSPFTGLECARNLPALLALSALLVFFSAGGQSMRGCLPFVDKSSVSLAFSIGRLVDWGWVVLFAEQLDLESRMWDFFLEWSVEDVLGMDALCSIKNKQMVTICYL